MKPMWRHCDAYSFLEFANPIHYNLYRLKAERRFRFNEYDKYTDYLFGCNCIRSCILYNNNELAIQKFNIK